jgi:hypothetical protein
MATPLQTTKCWDIGGAISTYESYDAEAKPAVVSRFRRRGWFVFVGFAIALLSALSALAYYWVISVWLLDASAAFLAIALVLALAAAWISARDIS